MRVFSISGKNLSNPDFVVSMLKNPFNYYRHLRRLVVSYKGEISLHFDLPSLYSCCVQSPLLRMLIGISAAKNSDFVRILGFLKSQKGTWTDLVLCSVGGEIE